MQVIVDFDTKQLLNIIDQLNINEKIKILKKLEGDTFEYRLNNLRNNIPDNSLSDDDVINEVMNFRNQ
jgi:hypothetical protein